MAPVADGDVRAHKGTGVVVPFASFPAVTSLKTFLMADTQTPQL